MIFAYNVSNFTNGTTSGYHAETKSLLADILERYYSLFLVCFGTIGNGLSLAVLSRKTFRTTPIGVYLRCLALSDLTALYTGCVYFSAKALFGYDIRSTSPLSCRFHRWISYTSVDMSSWILILVTVARLISIVSPLKTICTKKVAYIALVVTLIAALGVNFPMFLFYGRMVTYNDGTVVCKSLKPYKYFTKNVWHWIVLVKFAIIPVGVLIILNTFLCNRVFRSHDQMKKMNGEVSSSVRFSRIRYSFSQWRRKKLKNFSNPRKDSPCNLNISNTDITKMASIEELGLSLLQSNDDLSRKWRDQSKNASAEDVTVELIEDQEKEQGTAVLSDAPKKSAPSSASDSNKTLRKNPVANLLRKRFGSEKCFSKNKKLLDDSAANDNNSSNGPWFLSVNMDETCPRNVQRSQSLRCDSRNSFYLARDSLQYTKDKRKLTQSQCEMEDSGYSKDEDGHSCFGENKRVISRNVCNADLNRSNPIFTISPANGTKNRSQNLGQSDSDSGMEAWDDHGDVPLGEKNEHSSSETFKSAVSAKDYLTTSQPYIETCIDITQEQDNNCAMDHDRHPLTCNESQLSGSYDKVSNTNYDTPTSPGKDKTDVKSTLTAAIKKLQSSFSGSQSKSLSPSHTGSRLAVLGEAKDHQSISDIGSNSSRPISILINSADPGKIVSERVSPSIVSTGFLTPSRKDSQWTSSRRSSSRNVMYGRNKAKANSRNLTVTLLVINLVFILCNIPIVIFMTSRTYIFTERGVASVSYMVEIVSNFTMYTNNAINFILYCLTGTRFRVELRAMLKEAFNFVCRRNRRRH